MSDSRAPLPDILALVDPILGMSYQEYNCWQLLRYLYGKGWGIDFDDDPACAMAQVGEIWFQGDEADPLTVMRPWDALVFRAQGIASRHVGVVCDPLQFVHTSRKLGTCLGLIRDWAPPRSTRLLQIARLKRLL
jgi:cell wall-associated NlpC family hydrolase